MALRTLLRTLDIIPRLQKKFTNITVMSQIVREHFFHRLSPLKKNPES